MVVTDLDYATGIDKVIVHRIHHAHSCGASPLRNAGGANEVTIAIRGPSARVDKSTCAGFVERVCTATNKFSGNLANLVPTSRILAEIRTAAIIEAG